MMACACVCVCVCERERKRECVCMSEEGGWGEENWVLEPALTPLHPLFGPHWPHTVKGGSSSPYTRGLVILLRVEYGSPVSAVPSHAHDHWILGSAESRNKSIWQRNHWKIPSLVPEQRGGTGVPEDKPWKMGTKQGLATRPREDQEATPPSLQCSWRCSLLPGEWALLLSAGAGLGPSALGVCFGLIIWVWVWSYCCWIFAFSEAGSFVLAAKH